jgi:hypothetical protein
MFAPVIIATAILLVQPAASQTGGGGKGALAGLEALGNLLGNAMPGGFGARNMTAPMFPAEFLTASGTGKYPAVSLHTSCDYQGSNDK